MPSGFQQDTNQLAPSLYRVVWVASTGTYGSTDVDAGGGITPNSSDSFASTDMPTTLAKGKLRARGNMRWRNVVNRLINLADCQILDIEIGGETNGDAQATSLAFTVKYDRSAGVLDAVKSQIGSPYTGADGSTTITTTVLAIKDQVVRGFRDATTANVRVFNGANDTDNQLSITVAAPDDAADIWSDITVTLIDGTELVTADNSGTAE
jgi:hypothetical protein